MTYRASRKRADAARRRRAERFGVVIEPVNRERVMVRDNATCYMCGRKPGRSFLVLDHVIPLARGGAHSEENLKVACKPCNLRKGDRLPKECEWIKKQDGE